MVKLIRLSALLLSALLVCGIAPAETKTAGKKATEMKAAAKAAPKAALIDVNSAPVDVLKSLPGIGDAFSAKIVQNRPYKRKDEIVSKAGVPQATYDKIKEQIIAKQATAGKKK